MKKLLIIVFVSGILFSGCSINHTASLNNFGIIDSDSLGGMVARSAQPTNFALEQLNKMKFDDIVKLNHYDESKDVDYAIFKGKVLYYPFPNVYNIPSEDTIIMVASIIRKEFLLHKKILIQCTHGKDRTGLEAGTYEILYERRDWNGVEKERKLYGAQGLSDNIADSKIMEFLKKLRP